MSITELPAGAAGVDVGVVETPAVAVAVARRLRVLRDELASIVSSLEVSELVGSEAAL